jgi:cytochrome P450
LLPPVVPFLNAVPMQQCSVGGAGYETTSTALTFAIAALARHPEAEAKLLAEVDAFPWDDSAGVPYEHIDKLPYTRAVIDEAMR